MALVSSGRGTGCCRIPPPPRLSLFRTHCLRRACVCDVSQEESMSKEGYYLRGRVTWGTTVRGRGTIFPKVVLLIYRMPQRDAQYSKKKDEKRLVEKKGMKRKLVKTAAIRKASGASLKNDKDCSCICLLLFSNHFPFFYPKCSTEFFLCSIFKTDFDKSTPLHESHECYRLC